MPPVRCVNLAEDFGEILYNLRGELYQSELAEKLNISREYLCKMESGNIKKISYKLLYKIANYFDVHAGRLVKAHSDYEIVRDYDNKLNKKNSYKSNALDVGEDFGRRLKAARIQRDYSQSYLAELAGISKSTLAYLEGGLRAPTQKTFDKLCRTLRVKPEWLYGAPGEPKLREKKAPPTEPSQEAQPDE
jgi:transcriptional regulator with XRE-family HTH domain